MKYQKSMLKIYELLLSKESIILEDVIKKSSVGRTSGFKAIKWMEEKGLIKITSIGKQKQIRLIRDKYTLHFKGFLDSLKFKELNNDIKYIMGIFIDNLKSSSHIKSILLFGSVLYEKNPNDIDVLIVCSDKINKEEIIKIRDDTELLSDFFINLHFDSNPSDERLLNSILLYGFDYYTSRLEDDDRINVQFHEAISWYISAYNNVKNEELFDNCLDNAIINLGFVYSSLINIAPKTKNEAREIFLKQHRKLNKLKDIDNYKRIELIKGVLAEIGEKIYR